MRHPRIAQVVTGLPVEGPFDYLIPDEAAGQVAVGQRVEIPFAGQKRVGVITRLLSSSEIPKLKTFRRLLDRVPACDAQMLELARRVAAHYGCSFGEAVEAMLPVSLRGVRVCELAGDGGAAKDPAVNKRIVCQYFDVPSRDEFLRPMIAKTLAAGRGVVVLVPETEDIPGIKVSLKSFADEIALPGRRSSVKADMACWQTIRSGQKRLAIGTRSAVFTAVRNPGLYVIIDEENPSYKQEQSPHYHARDVLLMRQALAGGTVVCVSAVPSPEMIHRVRQKEFEYHTVGTPHKASIGVIDLSNYKPRSATIVSFPLLSRVQAALAQDQNVLLLLNRRGFNTVTSCNHCGHTIRCERCDINLMTHYPQKKLLCPMCDAVSDLPGECPKCGGAFLRSFGIGIEKLQNEMTRLCPQAQVSVYDREVKSLPAGTNVLIGTSAVLRMLPRYQADIAAVLDYDAELNRYDFRSEFRGFVLLNTLRQGVKEAVSVQTYQPDTYSLTCARDGDFKAFYDEELGLREELALPPFRHVITLTLRSKEKAAVFTGAQSLAEALRASLPEGLDLHGAQPDFRPKLRDQYRFIIMLKTKEVENTVAWLKDVMKKHRPPKGVIVTVDVDG